MGYTNSSQQKKSFSGKISESFLKKVMPKNISERDFFYYISKFYGSSREHSKRMEGYFNDRIFLPSSPVMANIPIPGRFYEGLPISCFLSEVDDSNFAESLYETANISSNGGGLGVHWSNLTPVGKAKNNGKQSMGVLSGIKIFGSVMKYQTGIARTIGSVANFLDDHHLEIEEFIQMRKNISGIDPELYIPRYVHHGVVLSDEFMNSVIHNKKWQLYDHKNNPVKEINARDLWIDIIKTRIETGEPYIMFSGNVNKKASPITKQLGLKIKTTNLCTEIVLPTGKDHLGEERTAQCTLGSFNLDNFYFRLDKEQIIEDIARFYDNVFTQSINMAINKKKGDVVEDYDYGSALKYKKDEERNIRKAMESNHPLKKALYSIYRSRDIGIGVFGLQTLFQNLGIPMESERGINLNREIFEDIKRKFDFFSKKLANELGECPDSKDAGSQYFERFVNKTAIAPTSSIAYISEVSTSIEPQYPSFLFKNSEGFSLWQNKILERHLENNGQNSQKNWDQITREMSVKNLVSNEIWEIFKSPSEIDQKQLIALAADRPLDQSQSINLFFNSPIDLKEAIRVHLLAYQLGIKTLYYLHSQEASSASKFDQQLGSKLSEKKKQSEKSSFYCNDEICTSCQ